MKRIIALALLLAGTGLGMATRASAQSPTVLVNVPFDFTVGNHVLPLGTYRISPNGAFLKFNNNDDQKSSLYALGHPGDLATDGRAKLEFRYVGGRYFLRRVVSNWTSTSVQFPVSGAEKKSQEIRASVREVYAETASR